MGHEQEVRTPEAEATSHRVLTSRTGTCSGGPPGTLAFHALPRGPAWRPEALDPGELAKDTSLGSGAPSCGRAGGDTWRGAAFSGAGPGCPRGRLPPARPVPHVKPHARQRSAALARRCPHGPPVPGRRERSQPRPPRPALPLRPRCQAPGGLLHTAAAWCQECRRGAGEPPGETRAPQNPRAKALPRSRPPASGPISPTANGGRHSSESGRGRRRAAAPPQGQPWRPVGGAFSTSPYLAR